MSDRDPSAEADTAARDAPDAEPTPGAPHRPTADELRLVRPPRGTSPPPVTRFRMRARRGRLEVVAAAGSPGGLEAGEGPLAEAERALGRGETERARALAATWSDSEELPAGLLGPVECRQRTVVVRAHLMDGDLEAARAVMGRARDDERLALADAALALGEGALERAARRIDEALERAPAGLAEHYTQALVRVAEGRLQEAMGLLAKVAASAPDHAVARHQLGQLVLSQGDAARAGTLFEMAMEIATGFLPPALALAEMLIDAHQYGEAAELLSQASERAPGALQPRLLQLKLLVEAGDTTTALQLGSALLKASPGHVEVASLWAEAMAQADRGDEAKSALEELLQSAAGDARARLLRVLAHLDLAAEPPRRKSALLRLHEAVTFAASPAELHFEIAQLHLGAGEPDAAGLALASMAGDPSSDLGPLLQGALLARNYGLYNPARVLGEAALERVRGTSAEAQIAAFVQDLPDLP